MQKIISEMMKNAGSFANLDFTKNMDSFKEFDAGKIGRQVLDFHKNAFDNTFETIIKIQDQSDSMTATLMGENKSFLDEGRKKMEEWKLSFRKNQLEFKKTFDDNYTQFISLLTLKVPESGSKSAKSTTK